MAGIQAIMQAAGAVGNTIGAIGDLAGAFTQKREAKKQLEMGNRLASQQRLDFQQTYGDLANLLQGQATYKGDVSEFKRAEAINCFFASLFWIKAPARSPIAPIVLPTAPAAFIIA